MKDSIDFTPIVRRYFLPKALRTDLWGNPGETFRIQNDQLRYLLRRAADTRIGQHYGFGEMAALKSPYEAYCRRVPVVAYEDIRNDVMEMIGGKRNVLWPGRCFNFAQSSGTSGGKSKYIPVTEDSLRLNHYRGGADCVAHYLRSNPESRMFAGKGFILGGSFASELHPADSRVRVGDLSATLISRINPVANLVRVPGKKIALMADWQKKLPALVRAAQNVNVTNISGVPSWFLTVIKEIVRSKGVERISDVWPGLEVFFHGGISFEPYRKTYQDITDPAKMHFLETYNASEGFFAMQNDLCDKSMLVLIDGAVFYEFGAPDGSGLPVPVWQVTPGGVYELVISSANGLWRYRLGDTVRVVSVNPLKILIAGRTRSFINAFGEELMEDNAEKAMAEACHACGCSLKNYTAAPVFASERKRGRHQWLVEWETAPSDPAVFAVELDRSLRALNSDYDAKRSHTIFLDLPEIITARPGLFDCWLRSAGNHKLGGQRKVPRLSNSRQLIDSLLDMN